MQQIILIADLIACSTCFGNHYAHHQELESIIQVVAACRIWCFGFKVVGMVWSSGHQIRQISKRKMFRPDVVQKNMAHFFLFLVGSK